jgi:3-ketoacyl-CoA synthase
LSFWERGGNDRREGKKKHARSQKHKQKNPFFSLQNHKTTPQQRQKFTPENVDFQAKILARSGLGDETYLPPLLITPPDEQQPPPPPPPPPPPQAAAAAIATRGKTTTTTTATATTVPPTPSPSSGPSMADARWEYEQVAYGAVREVLAKSGVHPRSVGVVITNCSLFNPTPSLSACIMNHFKMPSSTINYSLGGMGCSAGVVAIDLAKQMLQLIPNSYALVVSTENVTQNWYLGNQRSMLIPNCIFRVGGSAVLLSNRRTDGWRAKYRLKHVVRTNLAASDAAFQCVYEQEDATGHRGVRLSKELMAIAGEALKANITTLGPLVLPFSEQFLFLLNLVLRKVLGRKRVRPYIPDFNSAFEHVCIHTGGRGVIDAIEQQLALSPSLVEPSRAALYRYGNVSSSSVWYVLAYVEALRGVKRGDRVWQLAFGSGFKCNSAVWVANRRIRPAAVGGAQGGGGEHEAWRGFDVDRMRAHLADLPH